MRAWTSSAARCGQGRPNSSACAFARQLHVRCSSTPCAVLTREEGKNGKLAAALSAKNVQCVELPLIEHAPGPDRLKLPAVLRDTSFDWVVVTSPEGASVFVEGWREAGSPQVQLAVVGAGTAEVLAAAGLSPAFKSSKATGAVLGGELPLLEGGSGRVLYPASCRAAQEVQAACEARGFEVVRLNTYDTRGVQQVPEELLQRALRADVVTFASPSAVKAWVALVGLAAAHAQPAACIGATSARACQAAGLTRVFFPESPGVDGWADAVQDALRAARPVQPV